MKKAQPKAMPLIPANQLPIAHIGKEYRFLIEVNGKRRPMTSMKMLKDGSLVLVHMLPIFEHLYSDKMIPSRKGQITRKFKDMKKTVGSTLINPNKLTFHPSGIVNGAAERTVRDPLRTMNVSQQLTCQIYPHLKLMKTDDNIRKNDFTVRIHGLPEDVHISIRTYISTPNTDISQLLIDQNAQHVQMIRFRADSIEHSEHEFIVHQIVDVGIRDKHERANSRLILGLNPELVPGHLKSSK